MTDTVVSIFGVEPGRISGLEAYARELSRRLGERGWQSVLCYSSEPSAVVRRFLDLPNVRLEAVDSCPVNYRGMLQADAVLKRYRPRILHFQFTGFLTPYPWMSRLRSVESVFFTDQSSRPEGYVPRWAPAWKRVAASAINRRISRVVSVSEYCRGYLAATGLFPADRIERIYNSVDLARVPMADAGLVFRRKHQIPEDRLLVTQVSWLIPEKGVADFLRAAAIVRARARDTHFAVVGDGAWRGKFERLAAELEIGAHVTFTGSLDDLFMGGVYAGTDIFCLASRWGEAFGWVLAEAMAHGNPVVATRVGAVPEIVTDGVTGYVTERRDPDGMAAAILKLAGDPAARARFGEAGRQAVAQRFEVRANVARLLEVYGIGAARGMAHAGV